MRPNPSRAASLMRCSLRGAGRILAVGTRPVCQEAARAFGATDILSYRDGDIDEQVLRLTGYRGVDRVLIAGGDESAFAQAVRALRPGGCVGNVNYLSAGDAIGMMDQVAEDSISQAESINQLTTGVDQISAVVQTNSATSEESAAASEELSSQAVMMKQELQRFKLRGQADDDMPMPVQTPAPAPVSEAPASSYTAPRSYGDKY